MNTRKIFRFKYEPCAGMCYAYCKELQRQLRMLSEQDRNILVSLMVDAHDNLCDNPDYSFGVDVDEVSRTFVAHYRTPEKTDIFASKVFFECVNEVCSTVLADDIPEVANGVCSYGQNGTEDLGYEILRFCEDEAYELLQKQVCECERVGV